MSEPSPTAQNRTAQTPFDWSAKRADAAVRVAEDLLTDEQIAAAVGISRTTLAVWKRHPSFAARVDELVANLQDRARRRGLARLDKRQSAQFDRHTRMSNLILARAEVRNDDVPGIATGLVVTRERVIGSGDSQIQVTEHEFDAPLVRELRELEKQIAQDAGQWSEKREVTGPDGGPFRVSYVEVVAADIIASTDPDPDDDEPEGDR